MLNYKDMPLSLLIHEINKLHINKIKQETNKLGINPSYRFVFMLLKDNPNGLTQKQICDEIHYKASSVSAILVGMENEGLISRVKSDSDNRKTIVCLTSKGKELDLKIMEIFKKTDKMISDSFDEESLNNLKDYLYKISSVLKEGDVNV